MVDSHLPPILGLESCVQLNIVSRINTVSCSILEEFPEVFKGVGCFDEEHEICVDPAIAPVIYAARRVPISLMVR